MTKQFTCLIIGAGNIGASFDRPGSESVVTHAHAFSRHEGFRIAGFIDRAPDRSRTAAAVWGGRAFPTVEAAFDQEQIDVATIAAPDEMHYELLIRLAAFPVKLVFCEKPLAKTMDQVESLRALFAQKRLPVLINYTRRFVREFIQLQEEIRRGEFGAYVTGTGYYGKGIVHNGSHLVDLLRFFLGEIGEVHTVRRSNDYYQDDPSVSAVLTVAGGAPFFLQFVDCRLYTLFELDLLFERKRIRIRDSGFTIEEHEIREDAVFSGYRNMTRVKESGTAQGRAISFAVQNIHNHLTGSAALACSLEEAYKTMKASVMIRDGRA